MCESVDSMVNILYQSLNIYPQSATLSSQPLSTSLQQQQQQQQRQTLTSPILSSSLLSSSHQRQPISSWKSNSLSRSSSLASKKSSIVHNNYPHSIFNSTNNSQTINNNNNTSFINQLTNNIVASPINTNNNNNNNITNTKATTNPTTTTTTNNRPSRWLECNNSSIINSTNSTLLRSNSLSSSSAATTTSRPTNTTIKHCTNITIDERESTKHRQNLLNEQENRLLNKLENLHERSRLRGSGYQSMNISRTTSPTPSGFNGGTPNSRQLYRNSSLRRNIELPRHAHASLSRKYCDVTPSTPENVRSTTTTNTNTNNARENEKSSGFFKVENVDDQNYFFGNNNNNNNSTSIPLSTFEFSNQQPPAQPSSQPTFQLQPQSQPQQPQQPQQQQQQQQQLQYPPDFALRTRMSSNLQNFNFPRDSFDQTNSLPLSSATAGDMDTISAISVAAKTNASIPPITADQFLPLSSQIENNSNSNTPGGGGGARDSQISETLPLSVDVGCKWEKHPFENFDEYDGAVPPRTSQPISPSLSGWVTSKPMETNDKFYFASPQEQQQSKQSYKPPPPAQRMNSNNIILRNDKNNQEKDKTNQELNILLRNINSNEIKDLSSSRGFIPSIGRMASLSNNNNNFCNTPLPCGDLKVMSSQTILSKIIGDTTSEWYRPHYTRDQVNAYLMEKEPGSFVIRHSSSKRNAYDLAIKVHKPPSYSSDYQGDPNSLVRHFLIESTNRGVRLLGDETEPYFASLASLIHQHCLSPLSLPCPLRLLPTTEQQHQQQQQQYLIDNLVVQSQGQGGGGLHAQPSPITLHQHSYNSSSSGGGPSAGGDADRESVISQGSHFTYASSIATTSPDAVKGTFLYLASVCVENLIGWTALDRAISSVLEQPLSARQTLCSISVGQDGLSITDKWRKVFFRRHFLPNAVLYCENDRRTRPWKSPELNKRGINEAKIFGIVIRNPSSSTSTSCVNECLLFCECDVNSTAKSIINAIFNTYLIQPNNK